MITESDKRVLRRMRQLLNVSGPGVNQSEAGTVVDRLFAAFAATSRGRQLMPGVVDSVDDEDLVRVKLSKVVTQATEKDEPIVRAAVRKATEEEIGDRPPDALAYRDMKGQEVFVETPVGGSGFVDSNNVPIHYALASSAPGKLFAQRLDRDDYDGETIKIPDFMTHAIVVAIGGGGGGAGGEGELENTFTTEQFTDSNGDVGTADLKLKQGGKGGAGGASGGLDAWMGPVVPGEKLKLTIGAGGAGGSSSGADGQPGGAGSSGGNTKFEFVDRGTDKTVSAAGGDGAKETKTGGYAPQHAGGGGPGQFYVESDFILGSVLRAASGSGEAGGFGSIMENGSATPQPGVPGRGGGVFGLTSQSSFLFGTGGEGGFGDGVNGRDGGDGAIFILWFDERTDNSISDFDFEKV